MLPLKVYKNYAKNNLNLYDHHVLSFSKLSRAILLVHQFILNDQLLGYNNGW